MPGYTGFVPGVEAESVFGHTYGHASHIAMSAGRNQYYEFYRQSRYVAAIGSRIASGSSSQMH